MVKKIANCFTSGWSWENLTAGNDVARLERLGILSEYTHRERDRDWIARDIIHVIEQEAPNA